MDKSWIHSDRMSKQYEEGVEQFRGGCLENPHIDPNLIHCPCCKCKNLKKRPAKSIREHLYFHGFSQNYVNWIWHGESAESDKVNWSTNKEPIGNYHGDFETTNMCEAAYDNYKENPEALMEFLKEAEKPLYNGCKRYTKLSAIVKLYNTKAKHGMSDALFSDLLMDFGNMLPDNHNLPTKMYDAKKTLSCLALSHEKIHACSNDCILYRKQYKDCVNCPKCGLSRWKLTKKNVENKCVPAKMLWYFPPISRFKRMFKSLHTSNNLTWHAETTGVPADGINPYSNLSSRYSCWPIMLVTYNLPPNMCMKRKFIMLIMLISGPKQPGNDIDVYLDVLVEDFQRSWDGVDGVYDAYRRQFFTLKAILLWTINDFPAYGNLSGCTTHGYYACPVCKEDTCAKHLENGKKMSFVGHRRFLPRFHPYRRQMKEFDGMEEHGESSTPLSGVALFDKLSDIRCVFRKKISVKGKKRKNAKDNNLEDSKEEKDFGLTDFRKCWKKKSIFFNLPYWKHLHVRHCLDVMHIEKNVFEYLINALMNVKGKTKDNVAARLDMVQMGVRPELAPKFGEKRTYLPPAACSFTKKKVTSLSVDNGYKSPRKFLIEPEKYCHFLPILIRDALPKHVRYAIIRLCFFFEDICCKVIDVANISPPSFFDVMLHLTVHLVREVRLCGPVYFRWMYPFERSMKVLKSYVGSRKHPEGCIVRRYSAEEAIEFCSEYLNDLDPIGVPQSNRDPKSNIPGFLACKTPIIVPQVDLQQAHLTVLENTEERKMKGGYKMLTIRSSLTGFVQSCNGGTTSTLTWLAHGPRGQVIKYSSYLINGNLYQTKARDDERVCQNSGVSLVASTMLVFSAKDKNLLMTDVTFYGVIEEIWELDYHQFQVPLFKCAWVANDKGVINNDECGFTLVNMNKIGHKNDSFVLASQVNQVFYIDDLLQKGWSIVLPVPNRCYEGDDDGWTSILVSRPIDDVDTHCIPAHEKKSSMGRKKKESNATVEMIQGVHDDKPNEVTNAEHPILTDGEEHLVDVQRNKRGLTLMGKLIATAR
ncbi:uncharacterized protein LOC142535021 [Primulina tabacum]|uniref:uncharacterized protein LOC142535021 n=1 Tax=Primulina tabacum TaxID=48773 RepID=UPI003F595F7B